MRLPRWLARPAAFLGGFFWLPCPLCGDMMAGFEFDGRSWRDADNASRGHGYCDRHDADGLVLYRGELYRRVEGVETSDPEAGTWVWRPNADAKPVPERFTYFEEQP